MTRLDVAAQQFEARYGLVSVEGGRHPGWGTANRIVPLGDAYLELVAVADEESASRSAFGRWVAASATADGRPLGWTVRTTDLETVAARLGLQIVAGARTGPAGELRWRSAGIERAAAEPPLPFFIEWSADSPFPGAADESQPQGRPAVAKVLLQGDAHRIDAWLGDHALPIAVQPGPGALVGVVLDGTEGEVRLGSA